MRGKSDWNENLERFLLRSFKVLCSQVRFQWRKRNFKKRFIQTLGTRYTPRHKNVVL